MKENMKNILSTTQTTPKSNMVNIKQTNLVGNKPMKAMVNKTKGTKKGLVEHDMGYDIVEDIKKTKANISLFELFNMPQQRRKLLEDFDPQLNIIHETIEFDT